MGGGWCGGAWYGALTTAPAGRRRRRRRPHLMSLKKNYSQLIIMFILFSAYLELSNCTHSRVFDNKGVGGSVRGKGRGVGEWQLVIEVYLMFVA